jgi:hypothetical protein
VRVPPCTLDKPCAAASDRNCAHSPLYSPPTRNEASSRRSHSPFRRSRLRCNSSKTRSLVDL